MVLEYTIKKLRRRFGSGRRYDDVNHQKMPDGSFLLYAEEGKKKVTYVSCEKVGFRADFILMEISKHLRGDVNAPELYLPSLTIDIALDPFTDGADVTEMDDNDEVIRRYTHTWKVRGGVHHTKIYRQKKN